MVNTTHLIFVYNADSGFFNTLTDIAHKAFSPQTYQCKLCAITHDLLKEKSEWKTFISSLENVETEFLHRDEFQRKYSATVNTLPAIFTLQQDTPAIAITAEELNNIDSVDQLKQRVNSLLG